MEISIVFLHTCPSVCLWVCRVLSIHSRSRTDRTHTHSTQQDRITHTHCCCFGKVSLTVRLDGGRWPTGVTQHQVTHLVLLALCHVLPESPHRNGDGDGRMCIKTTHKRREADTQRYTEHRNVWLLVCCCVCFIYKRPLKINH